MSANVRRRLIGGMDTPETGGALVSVLQFKDPKIEMLIGDADGQPLRRLEMHPEEARELRELLDRAIQRCER